MAGAVPRERYRYKNEAFDRMLTGLLTNMTEEQKSKLPAELIHKIYRSKDPNVNGLTDAQKDYILSMGFGKRVVKLILDDDSSTTIQQFFALKDVWRKKKGSGINAAAFAEQMAVDGEFVLTDRDLYDALSYQALICYSPVFKMVMNARKSSKNYRATNKDFALWIGQMVKMFAHYESNKKRLVQEFGLENMSEWYCLLYFYDGEKKSSSVYRDMFKYSFSAGVGNLKLALTNLKKKGLLDSRGGPRVNMSMISPKGKALVDKMLTKYILNF